MRKNIFKVILLSICFFSFAVYANDAKISRRIDILSENISAQEELLSRMEGKYLSSRMNLKSESGSAEAIMKRAEFFFEKDDYTTAESIYYSVFNSLRYDKNELWEEATFKLAESLFLNKNYISAVRYYEMLLSSKPETRFKIDALKRLITSVYHLGQYSKAKTYYSEFRVVGYDISQDKDLIYFLGKSLFFDGQYEQAEEIFNTIGSDTKYYPQTKYFIGAVKIETSRYEKALKDFKDILSLDVNNRVYKDIQQIRELAILAAARIYFEKEEYHKAVDYYLKLDYKSENFVRAYYELCWAYIRREEYERAIDALRMIKYISPNEIISPRAVLLEGTLLIKMEKYGDAMILFESVVNSYSETSRRLENIRKQKLIRSMNSIDDTGSLDSFPVMVRSVLRDNPKFKTASLLKGKLSSLDRDIEQTEKLQKKVRSIIKNKNTASIFPPLKRGSETALVILNKTAVFRNRLLKIQQDMTYDELSGVDKKKYDVLENEKELLLNKINGLPGSSEEIEERKQKYVSAVLDMEKEAHLLSIEVKGLMEGLKSIENYYEREFSNAEDRDEFMSRFNDERDRIKELISLLESSREELMDEKNELRLKGTLLDSISIIRERYEKIIEEQKKLLSNKKTDYSKKMSDKLQKQNSRIDLLQKNTQKFRENLNEIVRDEVSNIKKIYTNEERKIEEYKSELVVLRSKISEMMNLAMYSNINNVKNTFSDIVLQADLGIIDVAWQRKEDATKEILNLRMKRSREIKRIRQTLENIQ
ncbi:MAG: tetratricopeptide repeat protein [bacterium]